MRTLRWSDLAGFTWMTAPVWVYDQVAHRVLWANSAAQSLWLADSEEELLQRELNPLSPAAATRLAALHEEISQGRVARTNWTLYPKGQPTQVNLTAVALMLDDGAEVLCFQGERIETAQIDPAALRGVEAVLHFSLSVVMFDLSGQVLMQNPAALRAFPQLAAHSADSFHRLLDDRLAAEQIWQSAMEYGADMGERQFTQHPKPRWYAYNLHRVLDPVTGGKAMLFTAQDVSERVQSEQKFRALFEQSTQPIWLYDPITGLVVDCNRAAAQALRVGNPQALINKDQARFFPTRQPDGNLSTRLAAQHGEMAMQRGLQRYEWSFLRADRSELLVEISLSPVTVADRQLLLGVWYDLSLRKTIERQLVDAKDAAEAANHAKSQFLANMSHEIRTPLNAIVGMTGLMLDGELLEGQRQWLEMVQFSSQGLVGLVGDILDFSRIEAGRVEIAAQPFDLHSLIRRTSELLRFTAEEKGLSLKLTLDSEVPCWVVSDEARLRQVLVNLLGNAIKFTARGQVSLSVDAVPMGGQSLDVTFVVNDTGIGIEQEKLDTIFEAFTQADDGISRRYGGSGLGLTISRRLVRAMGGEMMVQSEVGRGSTFAFSVPMQPAEAQTVAIEATAVASRSLSILLAEDNLLNQKLAHALLARDGHRITVACHGGEAVDLFMSESFDLVLMDMQMPEMDGLAATRAIRALEGDQPVPIIAMTANALPEDRERCLAAGMNDYLTKPISPIKLRAALAAVALTAPVVVAEAASHAGTDAVFDVDLALENCGGSGSLVRELVALFIDEWPARQQALASAFAVGDAAALSGWAHTLKGSFGAIGSSAGVDVASRVEQACRSGQIDTDHYEAMLAITNDCLAVMQDWLATP